MWRCSTKQHSPSVAAVLEKNSVGLQSQSESIIVIMSLVFRVASESCLSPILSSNSHIPIFKDASGVVCPTLQMRHLSGIQTRAHRLGKSPSFPLLSIKVFSMPQHGRTIFRGLHHGSSLFFTYTMYTLSLCFGSLLPHADGRAIASPRSSQ